MREYIRLVTAGRYLALLLLLFMLVSIFCVKNVSAADTIPYKMNFQGRLTGSNDQVVPNGTYNMRLRLYNAASGGNILWESTRLVSESHAVQVTNGQFTVQLGRIVALDPSLFNGSINQLYLQVELPSVATATSSNPSWTEGPMTPRNQVLSSAYSFNADKVDGLDGDDIAQIGASNTFTGTQAFNGASVSIGGAANTSKFNVSNLFNVDSTNSIVTIGQPDNVGTLLVLDTKNTAGDPTGTNGAMYFNSNSNKFRCFEGGAWRDCIGTRQIRSFIDTTADAVVDADTTNYWDLSAENNSSHPNIVPTGGTRSITGTVSFETTSTTTSDRSVVAHIERNIGSPVTCGSGTRVGTILSTFTTNSGEQASNTTFFVDDPNTTSQVYYSLCSDSATSAAAGMTVNRIRFTLEEAENNFN